MRQKRPQPTSLVCAGSNPFSVMQVTQGQADAAQISARKPKASGQGWLSK